MPIRDEKRSGKRETKKKNELKSEGCGKRGFRYEFELNAEKSRTRAYQICR